MPITQDRLTALISIVDEALTNFQRLTETIAAEVNEALTEFYSNSGSNNPLAASMLARLQQIEALASEPRISYRSTEVIATEREHFRVKRSANSRAAASMRRLRLNRG